MREFCLGGFYLGGYARIGNRRSYPSCNLNRFGLRKFGLQQFRRRDGSIRLNFLIRRFDGGDPSYPVIGFYYTCVDGGVKLGNNLAYLLTSPHLIRRGGSVK